MKRFMDLADFSREQILDLLALAQSLQVKPQPRALEGKMNKRGFLEGKSPFAAHTGFVDPTSPPRESIEVRTLVFFPPEV